MDLMLQRFPTQFPLAVLNVVTDIVLSGDAIHRGLAVIGDGRLPSHIFFVIADDLVHRHHVSFAFAVRVLKFVGKRISSLLENG